MNLSPKTLKNIGIIIIGITCAVLGFIITYTWRSENKIPEWLLLIPIFLPLTATFLIRKANKRKTGSDEK